MSERTDRPITSITTVSDVQKIDSQGMATDEPKASHTIDRDSKQETKAHKTNVPTSTAITTTIPTGKSRKKKITANVE